MNDFLEKTIEGLEEITIDNDLLATKGFIIDKEDWKEEDCVLIMGLNPAGGVESAQREKDESNRTYLFSIEHTSIGKSEWFYNKYYSPIYKMVSDVIGEVKWPWCNLAWEQLEAEFKKSELNEYIDELKKEYEFQSKHKCTIYVGDFFYYHVTDNRKLPIKKINKSNEKETFYKEYCREMLELHINKLKDRHKNIKYIYINNARVARWLCGSEIKTFEEIDGIKVFYGAILSNGNMDVFSVNRLVEEIKKEIIDEHNSSNIPGSGLSQR